MSPPSSGLGPAAITEMDQPQSSAIGAMTCSIQVGAASIALCRNMSGLEYKEEALAKRTLGIAAANDWPLRPVGSRFLQPPSPSPRALRPHSLRLRPTPGTSGRRVGAIETAPHFA